MFLDEPTTGFDPSARHEAWEIVRSLKSLGKTVLLTTHYMDEAQSLADRVAVVVGGRVVAEGPPSSLGGRDTAFARIRYRVPAGLAPPGALAGALDHEGFVELRPSDLTATLHELILWTRAAAAVPHLDPLMRIEAVTRFTAPAHEALERAVFGLEESLAEARLAAIERALAAGRLRAYVARVAEEPVGIARLWTFGELACLEGVGVVPRARRRGYGTLITTIATRAALATGHRLVWLEVARDNAAARRMYEKLGYRPAFEWDLWVEGQGRRGNQEHA
ncbi:MAG: hypothetical protein B7Z74_06115 [Deltaproteobacteria bacterium 21-66-5]|nr:MAG: hypothetical protein B7Z74_06115 [Deltaproteobacteria bacterium 21-66-5]